MNNKCKMHLGAINSKGEVYCLSCNEKMGSTKLKEIMGKIKIANLRVLGPNSKKEGNENLYLLIIS